MNLSDPAELGRFLAKHGIQADKSLGQHFLRSDSVVQSIVDRVADLNGILEIGPGPGILTARLADWDRKLTALELDERMIPALAESAPYAEVRQEDALKADFTAILEELPEPRGIVGNLPYYITAPLVNRIAESREHWSRAVLMMQKEVADRIAAKPCDSDRGAFSVFLQAHFNIEVVVQVPPEAFAPPPKVKSTVIELTPRSRESEISEKVFRVVKLGFTQPRKTLANNLSSGLTLERPVVSEAIEKAELRPDIRPHMLSEEEWIRLTSLLPS